MPTSVLTHFLKQKVSYNSLEVRTNKQVILLLSWEGTDNIEMCKLQLQFLNSVQLQGLTSNFKKKKKKKNKIRGTKSENNLGHLLTCQRFVRH